MTSRYTGSLMITPLFWHLYSPLSWMLAFTMSQREVFTSKGFLLWVHKVESSSRELFPLHVRVTFSPLNTLFHGGFKDTLDFQMALRRADCGKRYRRGKISLKTVQPPKYRHTNSQTINDQSTLTYTIGNKKLPWFLGLKEGEKGVVAPQSSQPKEKHKTQMQDIQKQTSKFTMWCRIAPSNSLDFSSNICKWNFSLFRQRLCLWCSTITQHSDYYIVSVH